MELCHRSTICLPTISAGFGIPYDVTRPALFAVFTTRPTSVSSAMSGTSLTSVSRNSFLACSSAKAGLNSPSNCPIRLRHHLASCSTRVVSSCRLPSLSPCDAVPLVTPVTKSALECYFEIVPGTEGTEVTLPQSEREGSPQLDTSRVVELAKWWRKRMGQLLGELIPGLAEGAGQEGITRNAGQRGAGHRTRYRGWPRCEDGKQAQSRTGSS